MRPGDFSIEDIELMLRKVARGDTPREGDILTFLPTSVNQSNSPRVGWVFTRLGLREGAFGSFSVSQRQIPANGKVQLIVGSETPPADIKIASAEGIRPGDFILIAPPEQFDTRLFAVAVAGLNQFTLNILNLTTPQKDLYTSVPADPWKFIALRLVI